MSISDLKLKQKNALPPRGPHVFCCLALEGVITKLHGTKTYYGDDFSVYSSNPFDSQSQQLSKILGSITMNHLNKSRLVILRVLPDIHMDRDFLKDTVEQFFYAILMQGFPPNAGGVIFHGIGKNDEYRVLSGGPLLKYPRLSGALPAEIGAETLQNASAIAKGMRSIYSFDIGFERIKRGLNAWLRAAREINPQEKLHNFVRSLDGFIDLARGEGKGQFISRGTEIIQSREKMGILLGELYDIRSKAEHLVFWEDALPKVKQHERANRLLLRAFQAERISSRVYEAFFTRPKIWPEFIDSKSQVGFWRKPSKELRKVWGKPINVDKEVKRRLRPIWP